MKNLTFPRTYTTPGAVYRAKKNYTERFPDKTFMVIKQDGTYVLDVVGQTTTTEVVQEVSVEAQEESEPPRKRGRKKKQVVESNHDSEVTYEDLNGFNENLFDDEDDYYVEPFGWEN